MRIDEVLTDHSPRVTAAAKLHRAAGRKKAGAFLAEGENAVSAALEAGVVRDIFVTESASARHAGIVNTAASRGVYVHAVTEKAARKLADTVTGTGIVAVCAPVVRPLDDLAAVSPEAEGAVGGETVATHTHIVAIAQSAADPGNAGTLIRIADAVGANHIIFTGDSADPQGPKAVRSSAGSLFTVPVIRHHDTGEALHAVRNAGYRVVATSPHADLSLEEVADRLIAPTAWIFGNEAHGLPGDLLAAADMTVRIPLPGRAESLNVAAAAAICMYASVRAQRDA